MSRNRAQWRRWLAIEWYLRVALALAPMLLLAGLFSEPLTNIEMLQMPLFITALCSLFITLPMFRRYKHALIDASKALNTPLEEHAWLRLSLRRRSALRVAALPAWIGAISLLIGLNPVALIMLAVASVVLCWLYRIPDQLA